MAKKIFKVVIGILAVVGSLINYNKALDFAADAIIELLPEKKGEEE